MLFSSPFILVVDDDPSFRRLVSVLCERAGFRCREVATGEEALAAAREETPDAVLLDVDLGPWTGYEVCRDLREEFGDRLAIIFVSGVRTERSDRVAGLLLGADDYVAKPVDEEELISRVRRAVARSATQPETRNGHETAAATLTVREQEILALLASGLGTSAIAAELVISPKTVATHVQRILAKLGVHSRVEAVAYAYREGIVGDVAAHTFAVAAH